MNIAHIVLENASAYERKSQRLDALSLSASNVIVADPARADLLHLYGDPRALSDGSHRLRAPYVSSVPVPPSRFAFRRRPLPRAVTSPLKSGHRSFIPEAVDDAYFSAKATPSDAERFAGTYFRASLKSLVEQTLARIHRFRDDVEWLLFDHPPSADEMAALSVWVDPAVDEGDFDGCTAEALTAGVPVVASRTAINVQRLEQGRTGFLFPSGDSNEMTHAILAALFKPELAGTRLEASRQTASKFRVRHRARALQQLYESILP